MTGKCQNRNPLERSGVSQYQRVLNALLPEYVGVDERGYDDLVLFAKKYAEYLSFYNTKNEADGNWTPFMSMDVSVVLATIMKQDTQKYSRFLTEIFEYIGTRETNTAAGKQDVKDHYKNIFDFIYTLFYSFNDYLSDLPEDFEFTSYLKTIIESKLSELFLKLDEYYKASIVENLLDENSAFVSTIVKSPISIIPVSTLKKNELPNQYSDPKTLWYMDAAEVEDFIPEFTGTTPASKIKNILQHNLFKGLIEQTIKNITNIVSVASNYFEQTISDFPTHTPHYALYLTFVKLFRYAQNDLNKFTGKHLDFYYKEVLQLANKAAEPDYVHLLFELNKNASPTLLPENTSFKAGKDADKKELFYNLTDDIVVNSGVVSSLKAIYSENVRQASLSVYAANKVNSQDGEGADLTSADKSWRPFGGNTNKVADLGFAIAHANLFMQEGTRTISILLTFDEKLTSKEIAILKGIKAQVTSAKEWMEVSVTSVKKSKVSTNAVVIKITVTPDKDAIVAYSEETHLLQMNTALPVLKILLDYDKHKHSAASLFAKHKLLNVKLHVDVIGLKTLALQNEVSPLDPSKPFAMFSNTPHIGSSFIYGSNEAFLKNKYGELTTKLNLEWDHIDKFKLTISAEDRDAIINKKIRISYLQDGGWKEATSADDEIFHHNSKKTHTNIDGVEIHISNKEILKATVPQYNCEYDFSANKNLSTSSRNGFMKIDFLGPVDFGHSDYVRRLTQAAIDSGTIPNEPYTPSVKAISLDYDVSATIDLTATSETSIGDDYGKFFHITPFGQAQQHLFFTGNSSMDLLPEINHEGELFIGLDKFAASQNINILFKVSDGSADPTKDVQDIDWYYLAANNQWVLFDEDSLVDETNSLTKTGIITFPFPADATDSNTLMGETLFWIRATVTNDTVALCSLIDLHAQAAKAVFTDEKLTGNYYKAILPAETISKLVTSNSAIKKISQPYASFDGRVKETDSTFYNRVSERLRHKQRAITMWDYERLVLEKFQQLYKVKCINHSEVRMNETPSIDNELAPGHVLVVPIPDLNNKNAVDPLKPQTDLGTLVEIEHYLREYTSPHVTIQVKNAKFEEIQLDFKVKFLSDDTAYYHDVLINDIEQFLSPWAYDAATNIEFGGRITKSVLLNFVEERSYVDYLTCFKLYHIVDGKKSGDLEDAIATTSRTVFVSYAGNEALNDPKHLIDYINIDCDC